MAKFSEQVYKMAEILDGRKASDILLIDVSATTIIADTFIVCTGSAVPHVKMLADELEEKMGKEGVPRLRKEGYKDGRWIVLDFGDVLVHIFHKDERAFYNIERLWMDPTNCEHYGTEVG